MLTTRQQQCLQGIGVHRWQERGSKIGSEVEASPATDHISALQDLQDSIGSAPRATAPQPVTPDLTPPAQIISDQVEQTPDNTLVQHPPANLDSWTGINSAIQSCVACELSKNCIQKVPGVGDQRAQLLIVGEGPGHDEDVSGEPFVGRSGQLLDRMLAAIGIARDQVFITNIVKCRPPSNRDPKQEEAHQCRVYLEAQIRKISPKVILAVGRVSAQNLLGSNEPVGKLIKQMHQLPGTDIPLKVTYHPAYLLRQPTAKSTAWQDLKLLHQLLQ